jgi:hypothetical protein
LVNTDDNASKPAKSKERLLSRLLEAVPTANPKRKGECFMGFGSWGLGSNFRCVPFVVGLFDAYPIGAQLRVGMDAGFWIGHFGGIQDGVALLTNAQLFSNIGTPIDGLRPVVRIPLRNITFVSQ